jgi:hypothetical protein
MYPEDLLDAMISELIVVATLLLNSNDCGTLCFAATLYFDIIFIKIYSFINDVF